MDRHFLDTEADWWGADLERRTDWIHTLSDAEVAEIELAYRQTSRRDAPLAEIGRNDFPLTLFPALAERAREALENGPGIYLIRGVPVRAYEESALRLIYWGLGKHIGTAVTQSADGDLLGDVRDVKSDPNSPTYRGYRSSQELNFHCDTADVTGLFVLRQAASGGMSRFASSVAAYLEMKRRDHDLTEVMFEPFNWSEQGQNAPGEKPYYSAPIFHVHEGRFACRYVRTQILNPERFHAAPPMSTRQRAAIDLFTEVVETPGFGIEMMLAEGDIVLLNNHTVLHARTAFQDADDGPGRHLLRLWLSVPNSRPLSPLMSHMFRDQRPGAVRGGFRARSNARLYETPAAR